MGGNPVETTRVAVQLLHPDAQAPHYSSAEAAGADLFACIEPQIGLYDAVDPQKDDLTSYRVVHLKPGETMLVKTGIAIELNPGFQAEVRPRSGLALKHGITVLNTPGTIDSDYRGEIGVVLINHGKKVFEIKHGDRIAQMVIMPVVAGHFEVVGESLSKTERGEGGFGSTGA